MPSETLVADDFADARDWLRFESELCAFSVLQAWPLGPQGHVWSLQNFNEVDHLSGEGLR